MEEKTLILSNEEMEGIIQRDEAIEAIEDAYYEFGRRKARDLPRRRIYLPQEDVDSDEYYWFNEKAGAVPSIERMAIRIDSATVNIGEKRGNARLQFPGAFAGLVLLFDTESNQLLSIMQDFYQNPIRVAVTSAIVTKQLARNNATTMGIFGSGTQAALQLEYNCEVTDLDEVRIYSTSEDRRNDFANRMNEIVKAEVSSVPEPREAVEGCGIVTTATNSNEPVFDGEWLEPGTHVNTMIGSDSFLPRRETDETTVQKSDLIVVNSKEQIKLDKQPELYKPLKRDEIRMDEIYEIGDLLIKDEVHGRSHASEITYHNNNVGMGIQFAALGNLFYQKATEQDLGTRVDADMFMQFDEDLARIRDQAFLRKDTTHWEE